MEPWEREYHTSRIVSGTSHVSIDGAAYEVGPVSRIHRLMAAEVHREAMRRCRIDGVMTGDQASVLLADRTIWTPDDEAEYGRLARAIEDQKVGLYENWSRSNARAALRITLRMGRDEVARMDGLRHGLDHLTCEGIAAASRARFLIGCATSLGGRPYWPDPVSGWDEPDGLLDRVMEAVFRLRADEAIVRELARSEPWRSSWGARAYAGRGLFDAASVDLTDEQRSLVLWSSAYDAIAEHPDGPDESVVSDDDMLDGWMILQRRRRDAERARKRGDEIGNAKIRGAGEIFQVAQTVEDARKIHEMNSAAARGVKARMLSHLATHKECPEAAMPHTLDRLRMAATTIRPRG